jgi:NADH-quinone oxidoreductase subunit N
MAPFFFIVKYLGSFIYQVLDYINFFLDYSSAISLMPEVIFFNAALFLTVYAVLVSLGFYVNLTLHSWQFRQNLFIFIFVCLSLAMIFIFVTFDGTFGLTTVDSYSKLLLSDSWMLDGFTTVFRALVLIVFAGFIVLYRSYSIREKFFSYEILILFFIAVGTILFTIGSYEFLLLYLCIELQALVFYVLAAFRTDVGFSAEAGIKYFIIGSFASSCYLLGVSYVYGVTGLSNFYHLNSFFSVACLSPIYTNSTIFVGLLLVFVGLLFKLGVAPFHFWLPDVYQGAPLPIAAFFGLLPKIALIVVLIRFYWYVFGTVLFENPNAFGYYGFDLFNFGFFKLQSLLFVCALISIVIASFLGLVQHHLKRFYAYSSIANTGFVVLALAIGSLTSLQSTIFYFFIYVFLSLTFLAIIFAFRAESANRFFKLVHLSDLNSPILGVFFSFCSFSLAGIPPFLGFFSKFYVYIALLESKYYFTVIFVGLLTILSTFYYIRLISILFFLPSLRRLGQIFVSAGSSSLAYLKSRLDYPLAFLISVLSLLNMLFFVHLDYLIVLTQKLVYTFFS